jgi:2-polyprenyl-3-methyl-5-hydroxy-6-metoxy-1,4-benzoquinol methylase
MSPVRDDPRHPDPGFAELYGRLPDATDLEPWLSLAHSTRAPVLYVGAGAGRLAVPLAKAGIDLVLVDAHPGMVAHLRGRLPSAEIHQSLIEDLELGRRFELVMIPSGVGEDAGVLEGAMRHLAPEGRLVLELTNPHWLAAGASPRFRVRDLGADRAHVEVVYPGGTLQDAEIALIWPEEIESWLAAVGLELVRMFGHPDAELDESPTFYVVAAKAPEPGNGSGAPRSR